MWWLNPTSTGGRPINSHSLEALWEVAERAMKLGRCIVATIVAFLLSGYVMAAIWLSLAAGMSGGAIGREHTVGHLDLPWCLRMLATPAAAWLATTVSFACTWFNVQGLRRSRSWRVTWLVLVLVALWSGLTGMLAIVVGRTVPAVYHEPGGISSMVVSIVGNANPGGNATEP